MVMGWTKGKGNDRPDIVQIENNTLVADPQGKLIALRGSI
jgi:hypothetical protein